MCRRGKSVNKGAVLFFPVQHSKQVVEAKRGQILCCAFLCVGLQVSHSRKSAPARLTDTRAADRVNSALEVSQRQARRRRGFNRLLELARLSLCPSPLFESSAHTAAQINHNCSTCSAQKCQYRLKKAPLSVCVFVCLSVCLFCLPFLPRNGGGGGGREREREENG